MDATSIFFDNARGRITQICSIRDTPSSPVRVVEILQGVSRGVRVETATSGIGFRCRVVGAGNGTHKHTKGDHKQ